MSLLWADFQAGLGTWIGSATGLEVQFQHEARTFKAKAFAKVSIVSSRQIGVGEVVYNRDLLEDPLQDMVPSYRGDQEITFGVLVTSRDQRPDGSARAYLEKLRTSSRRGTHRKTLRDAGLVLATLGPVVTMDRTVRGRVESIANIDLIFNTAYSETEIFDATGFVEKVEYSGTIDSTIITGSAP